MLYAVSYLEIQEELVHIQVLEQLSHTKKKKRNVIGQQNIKQRGIRKIMLHLFSGFTFQSFQRFLQLLLIRVRSNDCGTYFRSVYPPESGLNSIFSLLETKQTYILLVMFP